MREKLIKTEIGIGIGLGIVVASMLGGKEEGPNLYLRGDYSRVPPTATATPTPGKCTTKDPCTPDYKGTYVPLSKIR